MVSKNLIAAVVVPLCLAIASGGALAEDKTRDRPAAEPSDVESIDAIMAAVYDVISGDAGEPRDWDRFRSLFIEGARLIPYSAENGPSVLSPEGYIERAGRFFAEAGFHESEIGRKTERYGNIVHLMSAYEAKRSKSDAEPFLRGVNSFQLAYHENRWWVVTIYWQAETEDNPVPEEYLKQN
ncbi:MAG: hypothetical protein AAGD92_08035 [Pseudomonadota bacterium]